MEGKTMIEILTVIIIAYFILQIVIFRSGKPKMEHLTDWMEDTDRQINDLKINNDLQNTVIETLIDKIQGV